MNNQAKIETVPVEFNDKRIDTLFTRFTAIYGQLWVSAYQSEKLLAFAKKEWSDSLQRYDSKILREALIFFREHKNYPPSLPQFVECCRAFDQRKKTTFIEREPINPAKPEIARQHIKAMLDSLTH